MPELDLGSVIGPMGPKGDKGIDGAVGPMGPQGEKGDDGAAATINGVNAMTMTAGDGLEATMLGSAYHLKLTDKALNAVQTVPTLVRPNLLDNWYFGRPVDQRGGYIVPAGVQYYKVEGFVPQGPMPTTTKVDWIDNAGSARFNINGVPCYVPKDGGFVRGYVGSFVYAIDRWLLGSEQSNVMEITDGGIHVSYQQPGWNVIQKLKNVLCKGNTYTFSVVYKSTLPVRLVVTWGDGKYFFNESSPATSEWALVTITGTVPNNAEITYEQVTFQPLGSVAGTFDIKAAKLELGQTQTLAHQENGQWVLNEVPEYGEQLRRCQRYQFEAFDRTFPGQGYLAQVKAIDSTQAYGVLPTPVTMREGGNPALVTDCSAANPYGAFGIYTMGYSAGSSLITAINVFSRTQNGVILQAIGSNFVAGNDYQIWVGSQATNHFLLSLNL